MDVAELVAVLGLSVDEADWERGQELIDRARAGVEGLAEAHQRAQEAAHRGASGIGEAMHHGAEEVEESGKELKDVLKEGLETFVGYEGIKSLGEMVEHTMEATIQAKHLGDRLGITTEAVQSLGYAADVTGASTGAMVIALQRLSFNLEGTGLRTGFAQQGFQKLGLDVNKLRAEIKSGRPLDEIFGDIADKFAAMPNGAEKASLAMQIFGRTAGPQLIPLLNQGREGVAALREEAEELGVTMSEDGVEQLEQFEHAQKKLNATWSSTKDAIVMAILPALQMLVDGASAVAKFLRTHEDAMVTTFGAIAAAIAYVGYSAVVAWAEVLGPFLLFVGAAAAVIGAIQMIVDAFENGFTPLKALILGIGTVLALAFAPVLIPITAIGVAIAELVQHWDDVVSWFDDNEDTIANGLKIAFFPLWAVIKGVKWLIDHLDAIADFFSTRDFTPEEKAKMGESSIGRMMGYGPEREGGGGDTNSTEVHQHNEVTINTGASKADVTEAMDDWSHGFLRHALAAVKKGG